jgi:hypothetical protein
MERRSRPVSRPVGFLDFLGDRLHVVLAVAFVSFVLILVGLVTAGIVKRAKFEAMR